MQCAFCKEVIADDSFYCDICGEEIKTCPGCKMPGKGKVCTSCGKPLATLKSQAQPSAEKAAAADGNFSSSAQETRDGARPAAGTYRLPDEEPAKLSTPQLRLLNKNINVDLIIEDNAVIGRTTGQFMSIFGKFNQVSGKHCRFNFDPAKGWSVTDLGSTNKTAYNHQRIAANTPQILGDQSYLKIANIEFYVRIFPA